VITLEDVMAEIDAAPHKRKMPLDKAAEEVARAAAKKGLAIEWTATKLREAGYCFRENKFRELYNKLKKEINGSE